MNFWSRENSSQSRDIRGMDSYPYRSELLPVEDPEVQQPTSARKWSADTADTADTGISTSTAGSEAVAAKHRFKFTRRQVLTLTGVLGGIALLCALGAGARGMRPSEFSQHPLLAFLWPAKEPMVASPNFGYDPATTSKMAQLARAAFCSPTSTWQCPACRASGITIVPGALRPIHGKESLADDSTFAYVTKVSAPERFSGKCVIAFRGSRNFDNTVTDLVVLPTKVPADWNCPGCLAHDGFLQAFLEVESKLTNAIAELNCSRTAGVILAGHSMGGALATLSAWVLQEKMGYNVSMLYAFESPRLMDPTFAAAFDTRLSTKVPTWRLTHYPDPVPYLPIQSAAYMHVQREAFFYRNSTVPVLCSGVDDHRCMEGFTPTVHNVIDWKYYHCQLPYVENDGVLSHGNICSCSAE